MYPETYSKLSDMQGYVFANLNLAGYNPPSKVSDPILVLWVIEAFSWGNR